MEIGYSKKWPKLFKPIEENFTTFRFPWKNGKEFKVGQRLTQVIHLRSKDRQVLGIAEIAGKEKVDCSLYSILKEGWKLSDEEAIEDGFDDVADMKEWLFKQYGSRVYKDPIIKYTFKWIERK